MGGTCVIRGCVPKKLLVYGAAVRGGVPGRRRASGGTTAESLPTFSWERLIAAKTDGDRAAERHLRAHPGQRRAWRSSRAPARSPGRTRWTVTAVGRRRRPRTAAKNDPPGAGRPGVVPLDPRRGPTGSPRTRRSRLQNAAEARAGGGRGVHRRRVRGHLRRGSGSDVEHHRVPRGPAAARVRRGGAADGGEQPGGPRDRIVRDRA